MKVYTTDGKIFDLDFRTEQGYQNARNLIQFLKDNDAFKNEETDEQAIASIIKTVMMLNVWEEDVISMVTKHYYKLLKAKLEAGEIDEIDFLILQGKMVIEELEGRWS
jgi:hypothetical protein